MKNLILVCGLIFSVQFSFCQNVEEKLKKDLVKIENNKFIFDDYTLVKANSNNLQVKIHFESTNTQFITRDNFVYFSSELITTLLSQISNHSENAEFEDLEEITGTADVSVNCYLSKVGVQIETTTNAGVQKQLVKWSELM